MTVAGRGLRAFSDQRPPCGNEVGEECLESYNYQEDYY